MRLDKFAHNREAKAEPDRRALLALLLGEPVKYVRQEIRSNTSAVVCDPNLSVRIRLLNNDRDPPLLRRELNGIRKQVPNDLLKPLLVAHQARARRVKNRFDFYALRLGRVLTRLEALDRMLQAGPPHPLVGTGSLHASLVSGGRELSSYPDRATLQMERRTLPGEPESIAVAEVRAILEALAREDPTFRGSATAMFSRPAYEVAREHELPRALGDALARAGAQPRVTGASFWTDAAVLGHAGIPSILFGPGGAGLHSTEEYVNIADVVTCRNALVELALAWTEGGA